MVKNSRICVFLYLINCIFISFLAITINFIVVFKDVRL